MALMLWILLSLPVMCVYSEMKVSNLRRSTGLECQTLAIGKSWSSPNVVECFVTCAVRFPDTCQSIVFNTNTKNCTPGSVAFGPLQNLENTPIPAVNSGDVIYYVSQPIPACNTAGGIFNLYEICGVTACLHLEPTPVIYTQAVSNCAVLNSSIFLGNTLARFSIFWYVSLKYLQDNTWFSVTDRDVEETFMWENGDPVTEEQKKLIWRPGFPNAWEWIADEDCSEARHRSWPGIFGLNDEECLTKNVYLCEPFDAYFHW